jgi:hypothetical protein
MAGIIRSHSELLGVDRRFEVFTYTCPANEGGRMYCMRVNGDGAARTCPMCISVRQADDECVALDDGKIGSIQSVGHITLDYRETKTVCQLASSKDLPVGVPPF